MLAIRILNGAMVAGLIVVGILVPVFGLVVLCLVAFGCLCFCGIHMYAYGSVYWDGLRLRKLLKKQDRVMTLEEAKKKLAQGQGTIIIEAPTMGWSVNRLWWGPDHETAKCTEEPDDDNLCTAADYANYDRHVSEETGTAKLIDIFAFTTKEYLKKHFGQSEVCFVPSALVRFKRSVNNEA